MPTKAVPLTAIRLDGGTQMRADADGDWAVCLNCGQKVNTSKWRQVSVAGSVALVISISFHKTSEPGRAVNANRL
jgi:hypothetical protein